MLTVDQYKEVYAILGSSTPVSYDCGDLCNSICCSNEPFGNDDSYLYLFPGEAEYLRSIGCNFPVIRQKREGHYLPKSWGEYIYIAQCPGKSRCDRKMRPIQCRTFPLQPYFSDSGNLEMALCYTYVPYTCPFIEGTVSVSEDFIHAVYTAWNILIEDRAVRDLVKLDSKERRSHK